MNTCFVNTVIAHYFSSFLHFFSNDSPNYQHKMCLFKNWRIETLWQESIHNLGTLYVLKIAFKKPKGISIWNWVNVSFKKGSKDIILCIVCCDVCWGQTVWDIEQRQQDATNIHEKGTLHPITHWHSCQTDRNW